MGAAARCAMGSDVRLAFLQALGNQDMDGFAVSETPSLADCLISPGMWSPG